MGCNHGDNTDTPCVTCDSNTNYCCGDGHQCQYCFDVFCVDCWGKSPYSHIRRKKKARKISPDADWSMLKCATCCRHTASKQEILDLIEKRFKIDLESIGKEIENKKRIDFYNRFGITYGDLDADESD